jgi:hypothetical protein
MNNIENYRKRFFNLMESTIGDVKPLISEQDTPFDVRKVNQSDYMPKSDYLGAGGQFEKNYTPQVSKQNADIISEPIKKFENLKKKYSITLPKEEYYTSKNSYFQEWVQTKIKSLKPISQSKKFLSYAKDFFKQYFDYNKNPEIIDKISKISQKNGGDNSPEKIKSTIDGLLNSYLNQLNFVLDFAYNEKNPQTIMFVRPGDLNGKIYVCGLSGSLFSGYQLSNDLIWRESILHEIGHLVDGYFYHNNIKFHSSDEGDANIGKVSKYPHQDMSKTFFDFNQIIRDFDADIDYRKDNVEQFTRFKVLFDILSKKGLNVGSNLSQFIDSFNKCLEDGTIIIGYNRCQTKIQNGVLIIDKTCKSLKYVLSKKDFLGIYFNLYSNSSLWWLFSNYTTIKILKPRASFELPTVNYSIDLNKMYDDWKNEYVMNIDDKQSQDTIPDFPTA